MSEIFLIRHDNGWATIESTDLNLREEYAPQDQDVLAKFLLSLSGVSHVNVTSELQGMQSGRYEIKRLARYLNDYAKAWQRQMREMWRNPITERDRERKQNE